MSTFDYVGMAATATRLLNRFGRAMQVKRTTPGTYDPITGMTTGDTTTYADTVGTFADITNSYAASHEVQVGDRMLMLDASVAPELTDRIVVGASDLAIVNIEPINPAGTPLAYRLQVRGDVDASADGSAFGPTQASRTLDGGTF